jgi:GTPase SAR1 family protein
MFRQFLDRFSNRKGDGTVAILGLYDAGKTTMLYKLATGEVVKTIPSMGVNVESLDLPTASRRKLKLTLMDVGVGCGIFYTVVRIYAENSDVIIWMVDGSDTEQLGESVKLLENLLVRLSQNPTPRKGKTCPVLMYDFFRLPSSV